VHTWCVRDVRIGLLVGMYVGGRWDGYGRMGWKITHKTPCPGLVLWCRHRVHRHRAIDSAMLLTHLPRCGASYSCLLVIGSHSSRHVPPTLDATREEAERKERLRQLFGEDYKGASEKELTRVSMDSQLNEKPKQLPSDEDDALAGRRVKQQQSTSEMEQLLDVGARFAGLFTLVDGLRRGGLDSSIVPGTLAIARRDFPSKYIVCDQAYEVLDIYYQGMRGAEVERVPVASMDARAPEGCNGARSPPLRAFGAACAVRYACSAPEHSPHAAQATPCTCGCIRPSTTPSR
jgi:hypothetical protein